MSEYEDQKLLADHMAKGGSDNAVVGDDDSEDGSDTGMGDADLDDTNTKITAWGGNNIVLVMWCRAVRSVVSPIGY